MQTNANYARRRVRHLLTFCWPRSRTMSTMTSTANGTTSVPDWPERYAHVDQVLERSGPRTDVDSFSAGDPVSLCALVMASETSNAPPSVGQRLFENPMQNPCYWGRRTWVRDSCQPRLDRLQGHSCDRHGHHRHLQP